MKSSFLSIFGAVAALAVTQTAQATSPDYVVTTSSGAVIVPGTDDTGNHCDECVTTITLPFPVIFYDQVFNSATVSSNGNLQFSSTSNNTRGCLSTGTANNLITAYWTDLVTSGNNDSGAANGIFTSISGTAPNRIFNIEWRTSDFGATENQNNFEIRLYEGQRRIDLVYGTMTGTDSVNAGVGVQRDTGSQFTSVSCGTTPTAGTQYTFTIPDTCVPPPPNMVAWWRGDGNADDSVGGHNGALLGGVAFGSGEVQQAFSFDGASAHVEIPDSSSLNPTSQITIDAWVKTSAVSRQALVSKFNQSFSSPAGSYDLAILNDSLLEFRLDNVGYLQVPAAICDGQWHHVAGTYDGATIFCYVDGVLAASTSASGGNNITTSTLPLYLGAELRDNADSGFFNGQLDEVEIFNRALSGQEITDIFIAGSAGKCKCTPPPDNMVSWWPAEGNAADIQDSNTGTTNSGVGFAAGEVGQGFDLDGATGFVDFGAPANLQLTSAITVDAWVRPDTSYGNYRTIVSKWSQTVNNSWGLFIANNTLYGYVNTGGGGSFAAGGSIPFGPTAPFSHVAMTYSNADGLRIYLNGVEVGSSVGSGDIIDGADSVRIGNDTDLISDRWFDGVIDEVEIFGRVLGANEISDIFHAGSAGKCRSCVSPPPNMVSWWPGDGNLTDIQGGHNGTGSGGGPSFSSGKVGQAMDFDGIDDFFTAANVPDPNKAFTFDAWVYWRGPTGSGQQNLVEKLDGLGGASYLLAIVDSGLVATVIGGNLPGGITTNTSQTIPANQWTHIVETDDGSTVNIYINGQLDTSVTADRNTSSDLLYFGSTGSQFFLNGEMDEIEIYSRALTQSEVQAIYDAGSGGKCKPAIPSARRLANISTRASVGTDDNVAIGGFIIHSDPPKPGHTNVNTVPKKRVIIRGIGPSLQVNGNPLTGRLMNPVLELHDSNNGAALETNDNWGDAANASDIQATGLAPSDPNESAILVILDSNNTYTAILSGAGNTTGIGLVEVFDLDVTSDTHLANISTRGFVSTGDDVLIGGLIVQGGTPARVVLRAIGPSLTALGVAGALQDPVLELHDTNGALVASNDDWMSSPDKAAIIAAGLNPSNPKESAILFVPAPGIYTAVVRGNGPTPTGVGLVEAYRLEN